MATITPKGETQRDSRRFDPRPGRVRYSRRWLGAGAAGAALGAVALAAGGPLAAAALGATGLAGAAYATLVEPRSPRLERLTLRFAGLPPELDGLRIGHLSDLHLGQPFSAANARWAAAAMAAERPDLLALTGDFVSYDHAIAALPDVLAPLAVARPPLGAYAVPGNHDHWEGVPAIRAALAPLGVEFLMNAHRALPRGAAQLVVAGVDDQWEGDSDLDMALRGAPAGFRLLLAHCPDVADDAARLGVDLQLSGHTHGGHMRLPGLGSFCLPRHGWSYAVGHERVGDLQLYVSRGSGGLPLRLNCAPEATILTLRRG
jgi:uncharacterized protein